MFYMHACCVTAVLVGARWWAPLRCCSARASVAEYTIVIVSLSVPPAEEADGSATDTWAYVSALLYTRSMCSDNGHVLVLALVDIVTDMQAQHQIRCTSVQYLNAEQMTVMAPNGFVHRYMHGHV